MFIKSVIIDGFKSYGRRTELHGFDPEFTAITGLNGTGKSNILDAICFVLGITTLSHVRVTTLQDLVYKGGQSGVTKATVTLIFDNTNINQCPIGYEKCREISVSRQIIVGGKNKYLINGKLVQNKKVMDFFCCVQLNVNNPNFLIMQGRITKVLNMKPQEILSMIEEAAGTSLYEAKRQASTKLIEKKDAKVKESNTILHEEIEPKLEKLRQERSSYMEFQKICRDIDYLTRLHVSYRYLKYEESLKNIEDRCQKNKEFLETAQQALLANEQEETNIEKEMDVIRHKADELRGGHLKEIEQELDKQLRYESETVGSIKAQEEAVRVEKKKLLRLTKKIDADEKDLLLNQNNMDELLKLSEELKQINEKDIALYNESRKYYESLSHGLTEERKTFAISLQSNILNLKDSLPNIEHSIKTFQMEVESTRHILMEKQEKRNDQDSALNAEKEIANTYISEINKLKDKLNSITHGNETIAQLQVRCTTLEGEILQLENKLSNRNRYEVEYYNIDRSLDRSKVCGLMCKLFDVRDVKHQLALTITGGGNLHCIVTDDEETAKKLLKPGCLKQRGTVIPITKVKPYVLNDRAVNLAQKLVGKENCQLAVSLIDYNPHYDPVMKYVFGHTLICRDIRIAKQVTYNKNIHCRSVTLAGEVVDPTGVLSGGPSERSFSNNLLQRVSDIKKVEREIIARQKEIKNIHAKIGMIESSSAERERLTTEITVNERHLEACKERLEEISDDKINEEIKMLEEQLKAGEDNIMKSHNMYTSTEAKIEEIEKKLANLTGFSTQKLQAAQDEMMQRKTAIEQSYANWKSHEETNNQMYVKIEGLKERLANTKEQRVEMEKIVTELQAKLDDTRRMITNSNQVVSVLKEKLEEERQCLNAQNKDLKLLNAKKMDIQNQRQGLNMEIKKREGEIVKAQANNKECIKDMEMLCQKYSWINEEKQYFGVKNSRYDYTKEDPIAAGEKLIQIKKRKEKLEGNINTRAMTLLEREEERYLETLRRKKIVEDDKEKIKFIIIKMDEKKREALEAACHGVNENFKSIFSTLLPGAEACLNQVKRDNQIIGLEIKVGFNGFWKESLSELSGGQRSLVALSLVLAMLKFSPAPVYILDEVDAALDMSHTQNIGNMLKKHFTASQFIIVSLKDGMFNNANVLFQTKFEDGVSCVSRTVNPRLHVRD